MRDASGVGTLRNIIESIFGRLTQVCLAIAAAALIGIVAVNGANVVARYIFRAPFPWAEELMLYLMILAVFTAAIAVTWRNLHVRIDAFIERAPPGVRRAAQWIGTLVSIAAIAVVTFFSCKMVMQLHEMDMQSDALRIPSWIPQSLVPIGLGLIALLMAVRLVVPPPEQPADGSADLL